MALKLVVSWWVLHAFLCCVIPPLYHQPITGAAYLRRQADAHQAWGQE